MILLRDIRIYFDGIVVKFTHYLDTKQLIRGNACASFGFYQSPLTNQKENILENKLKIRKFSGILSTSLLSI